MAESVINLNGTLWIFAWILIAFVLLQAYLFTRLALRFNRRNHLVTRSEAMSAVRTGTIAAIGPALSSVVVALSLIAVVGPATTFMRCGVIGAPFWEMYMGNIAASAAGVTLGGEGFTEAVFVLCIFGMVLGSAPYFINTIIALKPLDNLVEKSKEKKQKISFIPYLSNGTMCGLLAYSVMDYFTSTSRVVALVMSAIGNYLVSKIVAKTGSKILSSFSLAISMMIGMAAAQAFVMFIQ